MSRVWSHWSLDVRALITSLAQGCSFATRALLSSEALGQTAQVQRTTASDPTKFAEGYGREATACTIHRLRFAQALQKELETHVLLSRHVGLLTTDAAASFLAKTGAFGRKLRNLVRSLEPTPAG